MTLRPLQFDERSMSCFDRFALLADQEYNYGNRKDWFGQFRNGFIGAQHRLSGVLIHLSDLYDWKLPPSDVRLIEYNVASFFFNADSAIECTVYALNALGNCVAPELFIEIAPSAKRTKISPSNICPLSSQATALPGYAKYFPELQQFWREHTKFLRRLMDHHDVSKHRGAIYRGGSARLDPPAGYFERLGIPDNERVLCSPCQTIFVSDDPKLMTSDRNQKPWEHGLTLENLALEFERFINATYQLALSDARANIPLNVPEFPRHGSA